MNTVAVSLRVATADDLPLIRRCRALTKPREQLEAIEQGRVQILVADGSDAGFMQTVTLWGKVPFVELLFIADDAQGKGVGRAAVAQWEARMRADGHTGVLTSSQPDETGQHFWRKQGYRECGILTRRGWPAEVMFEKQFND